MKNRNKQAIDNPSINVLCAQKSISTPLPTERNPEISLSSLKGGGGLKLNQETIHRCLRTNLPNTDADLY